MYYLSDSGSTSPRFLMKDNKKCAKEGLCAIMDRNSDDEDDSWESFVRAAKKRTTTTNCGGVICAWNDEPWPRNVFGGKADSLRRLRVELHRNVPPFVAISSEWCGDLIPWLERISHPSVGVFLFFFLSFLCLGASECKRFFADIDLEDMRKRCSRSVLRECRRMAMSVPWRVPTKRCSMWSENMCGRRWRGCVHRVRWRREFLVWCSACVRQGLAVWHSRGTQ